MRWWPPLCAIPRPVGWSLLARRNACREYCTALELLPLARRRFRLLLCRETHDPDFATKIAIEHHSDEERVYRFALYDLDNDERVTEDELVGEVFVSARQLVGGLTFELPLTKHGKKVPDASIIFNSKAKPSEKKLSKTLFVLDNSNSTSLSVSVACHGFPILSENDALVCVSVRDANSGHFTLVGQTERVP